MSAHPKPTRSGPPLRVTRTNIPGAGSSPRGVDINSNSRAMSFLWIVERLDVLTALLLLVVTLIVSDYVINRAPKNFPPCPPGLPFVGNALSFAAEEPYAYLSKLAEKYGNVFSLRLGQKKTIYLNSFKMVKEALVTHPYAIINRPVVPIYKIIYKTTGIGLDNDYKWKMHKKFTLSTLRNFGVGRRSLEFIILEELKVFSEALKEKHGKPFDPHMLTSTAISNVICSMLFGRRFEYSDAQFDELMHLINSAVYLEGSVWAQAYNAFPGIMKFLPGRHNELFSKYAQVFDFMRNEIEEHKKDWDPAAPRDYIDYYLSEIKKGNNDVTGFTEGTLTATIFDLFVAGSETTATTILWALLFMVKYPNVQEKVQTEIESVMGQDGPPSMDNRSQMPFTEAVICEVHRMGNVIPLSLTRITSDDISLGGYLIPKDTTVVINLSSVLNDKSEWETPDMFTPDHFLDSDGKLIRRDAFLPFLTGKRTCLGETLARMQVFLFFTSLLQKFTFRAPAGVEPSLNAQNGFTRNPVPFKKGRLTPLAI
uniref:Uncharacterized protein n=1 Tax=Erpetoichthys calabaricus TaxID=27687 RepID=A0A8C4TI23_ERPCA